MHRAHFHGAFDRSSDYGFSRVVSLHGGPDGTVVAHEYALPYSYHIELYTHTLHMYRRFGVSESAVALSSALSSVERALWRAGGMRTAGGVFSALAVSRGPGGETSERAR